MLVEAAQECGQSGLFEVLVDLDAALPAVLVSSLTLVLVSLASPPAAPIVTIPGQHGGPG